MNKAEEAAFLKKEEQHFKGHRGSPLGRDFRAFRFRYDCPATDGGFQSRFDETFPDAPLSPGWWKKRFKV